DPPDPVRVAHGPVGVRSIPPPQSPSAAAPPTCGAPSTAAWVPVAATGHSHGARSPDAALPHPARASHAARSAGSAARAPQALRPAAATPYPARRESVWPPSVVSALARPPNRE